jgi:hypothetical protein
MKFNLSVFIKMYYIKVYLFRNDLNCPLIVLLRLRLNRIILPNPLLRMEESPCDSHTLNPQL